MLTDTVKMATGLVARGGLGLPLRIAAFAGMAWVAWKAWLTYGVPYVEWADENYAEPLVMLSLSPLVIATIVSLVVACDSSSARNRHGRPWGLWDFLRRAPFAVWCLITDDGRNVPIWAILSWPAVAVVDFVIAVGALAAVPLRGLWIALRGLGRVAWRGLSYTPLDRG